MTKQFSWSFDSTKAFQAVSLGYNARLMLTFRFRLPYCSTRMRFLFCLIASVWFFLWPVPVDAQCNMRVMDTRELVLSADLIARVRVRSTKSIRNPMYGQLATLEIIEVIYGDPRRQEVRVWAMSTTYCARDAYAPQQEMLVFLARDQTLFHTVNWQYGQFLMNGDTVEDWRGRSGEVADGGATVMATGTSEATVASEPRRGEGPRGRPRPFAEVKQEILTLLEEARRNGKSRRP